MVARPEIVVVSLDSESKALIKRLIKTIEKSHKKSTAKIEHVQAPPADGDQDPHRNNPYRSKT